MRVLVTGDRNYKRYWVVWGMISGAAAASGDFETRDRVVVIEGEADGADSLARDACKDIWCAEPEPHPANWYPDGETLDRGAGHKRNQEMVNTGADVCIAFKDKFDFAPDAKGGTEDCVRRAVKAGIPTYVVVKVN